MNKAILLILTLVLVDIVVAEKAAVISADFDARDKSYENALKEMGFTVDRVNNAGLLKADFSNYSVLLISNDVFSNWNMLPINKYPSLIMGTRYLDEFYWASRTGTTYSSSYLPVYINYPDSFITQGLPLWTRVYNRTGQSYNYISSYRMAPGLNISASAYFDSSYAVVATVDERAILRDGAGSKAKGVFFGIHSIEYWTPETRTMFKRSVEWLATEQHRPIISKVNTKDITKNSARISWVTSRPANCSVNYGMTKFDNSFSTNHEALLGGLSEKMIYTYNINCCGDDEYCTGSGPYSFTTKDESAPLLVFQSYSATNTSASLSAAFDEPATLSVYFGINKLGLTYENLSYKDSWQIELQGLSIGTKYNWLFKMCDNFNNCRNSSVFSLTTQDYNEPNAPVGLKLGLNDDKSIGVYWQTPMGEAIHNYNIYMADRPDGFDFGSADASINSTEYTDAILSKQKYYIVRSEDAFGNEEKNMNIAGKFDLELKKGYNAVSIPLMPFDQSIPSLLRPPVIDVMKFENGNFTRVGYSDQLGRWLTIPGFEKLKPCEGYFMYSREDQAITVLGTAIQQVNLGLHKGMNLACLSLAGEKDPGYYAGDNILEIANRNEDGHYSLYSFQNAAPFSIKPGIAYWLKANEDSVLEVTR